jgi:hypothetical protein
MNLSSGTFKWATPNGILSVNLAHLNVPDDILTARLAQLDVRDKIVKDIEMGRIH